MKYILPADVIMQHTPYLLNFKAMSTVPAPVLEILHLENRQLAHQKNLEIFREQKRKKNSYTKRDSDHNH